MLKWRNIVFKKRFRGKKEKLDFGRRIFKVCHLYTSIRKIKVLKLADSLSLRGHYQKPLLFLKYGP